eukprot:superscaffoldBa00004745_g19387
MRRRISAATIMSRRIGVFDFGLSEVYRAFTSSLLLFEQGPEGFALPCVYSSGQTSAGRDAICRSSFSIVSLTPNRLSCSEMRRDAPHEHTSASDFQRALLSAYRIRRGGEAWEAATLGAAPRANIKGSAEGGGGGEEGSRERQSEGWAKLFKGLSE